MTKYKVGIIGTGFGAKVQAPAMQKHDRFDVELIAGTKEEKTKEIADELGIDGTTNWEDLLTKDLDLIVVSTPPYLHYKMAKEVLKSDTNLLLEKPTTSNAFEAKKLLRLSKDRDLVAMLSHEFRWVPERAYLRDLIQSGEVGKVQEMYLQQFMNFGASKKVENFGWFWNSLYEGGMIGALGSHLFDWFRFLTEEEFTTIQGGIQTVIKEKVDANQKTHKVTADTGFNFNFTMSSGIFGNITSSSTIHHPPSTRLVIAGDNGTITLNDGIHLGKEGEEMKKLEIPDKYALDTSLEAKDRRIPPYLKFLDQISKSLDMGLSLSPSLYDGWRNQQVIDAVKASDRSGNRITIID